MWKKLIVFSLTLCLSLVLLQVIKYKIEPVQNKVASSAPTSNEQTPFQTAWNISRNSNFLFGDCVRKLQKALAENDRKTVVSLIKLPIEVRLFSKGMQTRYYFKELKNENEFLANYDKIFDDPFGERISRINADKLFYSSSGEVFTPNHEIRMDRIYKNNDPNFEIKIIKLFQ